MPTSAISAISPILDRVEQLEPKSVLDLGIGYGKYGCLCREYLGKQVELIGVEAWPQYRRPAWGEYTDIWLQDYKMRRHWSEYQGFDLVLWIDGPEHLGRDCAEALLVHLLANNARVIVSVPLGWRDQGAVGGNEFERHRSMWQLGDFHRRSSVGGARVLHQNKRGVVVELEM